MRYVTSNFDQKFMKSLQVGIEVDAILVAELVLCPSYELSSVSSGSSHYRMVTMPLGQKSLKKIKYETSHIFIPSLLTLFAKSSSVYTHLHLHTLLSAFLFSDRVSSSDDYPDESPGPDWPDKN